MWIINKMMLGCDQASFLVSKKQETDLSFKEKIQLKMHFIACKMCKHYETQSQIMADNLNEISSEKNHSHECMSNEDKSNLKELLKNKIKQP